MMSETLIYLGVSLLGVLALVGFSWILGALKSAEVTESSAVDRLSFDEPDFKTGEWFIGADGKSAAALSADGGETALVFAVGDGLGTRRFRHGAVGVELHGNILEFALGEPSLRKVRLAAPDPAAAAQWVLKLAGARL